MVNLKRQVRSESECWTIGNRIDKPGACRKIKVRCVNLKLSSNQWYLNPQRWMKSSMMNGDREEIKEDHGPRPGTFQDFLVGQRQRSQQRGSRRSSHGGGRKTRTVWQHGSRSSSWKTDELESRMGTGRSHWSHPHEVFGNLVKSSFDWVVGTQARTQ